MTPDPNPTLLERAEEMEAAAHKALALQDLVFADECTRHAHHLRMQAQQEQKKHETH